MRQTTLCVPLEVKPESCSRLSCLIDELKSREDQGDGPQSGSFERIAREIPALHFMSMSVFPGSEYDPLLVIEANFDGEPGPFFAQLEAALGPDIRAMLRCCKRPLDRDRLLYDAVTAQDAKAPLAPYLEARTRRPSVFHHGNRGLTRPRIMAEHTLFLALRDAIDRPPGGTRPVPHELSPPELHTAMRQTLLPAYPWLAEPAPPRITPRENIVDWLRLAVFAVVAIVQLSSPGLLLAALLPLGAYLLLMAFAVVCLALLIRWYRHGLPGTETTRTLDMGALLGTNWPAIALVTAIYVAGTTLVLTPIVWLAGALLHWIAGIHAVPPGAAFVATARAVALSLIGLLCLSLPLLLLLVRWNELEDSAQDAPRLHEPTLRDMLRQEDWVTQNHMGSVVLIKPGILRSIVIRSGHLGLGLALRLLARDGYLGSMRTVHFAHWAFLNNGSRLLFLSNFDHSWGSYLDDFIEKAHGGLTLAWGCGVGFPASRFLVLDGASHGRQFKTWALASRAVSRFWFSAYPALTVDQIERNTRIADALRKPRLQNEEAVRWMQDL